MMMMMLLSRWLVVRGLDGDVDLSPHLHCLSHLLCTKSYWRLDCLLGVGGVSDGWSMGAGAKSEID